LSGVTPGGLRFEWATPGQDGKAEQMPDCLVEFIKEAGRQFDRVLGKKSSLTLHVQARHFMDYNFRHGAGAMV
jgi:hypothetical protein